MSAESSLSVSLEAEEILVAEVTVGIGLQSTAFPLAGQTKAFRTVPPGQKIPIFCLHLRGSGRYSSYFHADALKIDVPLKSTGAARLPVFRSFDLDMEEGLSI